MLYSIRVFACILAAIRVSGAIANHRSLFGGISTPKPLLFLRGSKSHPIDDDERIQRTNQYLNKLNNQFMSFQDVKELRIIIISDQGGHSGHPSTEYLSAIEQIAAIHKKTPIHAILTAGDNVYPHGIDAGSHHLLDALFKDVFSDKGLHDVPFFAVMGNHDHCLQPMEQIKYSMQQIDDYLSDADKKDHPVFVMPDWFYNVQLVFGAKPSKIDFTFIDSMINRGDSDTYSVCNSSQTQSWQNRVSTEFPALKKQMHQWLKQEIRNKKSDFKSLVMHHAIHSTMKHGGCNQAKLLEKEVLRTTDGRFAMDLVISGHDHAMEYGEVPSTGLRQAIVGGTRHCDGLTTFAKVRDFIASAWTGEFQIKREQQQARYQHEYREYEENVESTDPQRGWKGCEYGGFAQLVFTEDGRTKDLGVEIAVFSGDGKKLYAKKIQ